MDSSNYLQIVVPTSDTAMCRKKSIHINMYICDAIWFSQFYSINQVYNTRCKTKIEVKNGSQFIGVLPLPLSGILLYPRLPPSSPLSLFCQCSTKIGWVLFILLSGERHCENQVSWFSTQRLNTKTWPMVSNLHLSIHNPVYPNHKANKAARDLPKNICFDTTGLFVNG